ncbi:MAG: hypothetical protein WD690_10460 [Vicinamibacterales bacterium]
MSGADALSFATALAQAGHPAGFIVPADERQTMLAPESGHMVTLDEAIPLFTAKGTYRIVSNAPPLVFRHAETPADIIGALNARRVLSSARLPLAQPLFDPVLRSLAYRRVAPPAGRTKEPGAGPECPVETPVRIAAGAASTIDTLGRLVAQTTGVAWVVRFAPPGRSLRLQIGYVCASGAWSALSVPGW